MTETLSSQSFGRLDPDRLLETHLAWVLFAAQRSETSGVLTVDEGNTVTRIHLLDGQVTYVDRGPLAETLGRLLLREEIIDREEYLVILERMAEPSRRDEVVRFGEVAIQLGMLTPNELHEALAMQVRQKLIHVLQLDHGFWHFDAKRDPAASRFPVKLEPALREALRDDPQSFRWAGLLVAKGTSRIDLTEPLSEITARFQLQPSELRFMRAFEGRALSDAIASKLIDPTEAGVLLVALLFAGALSLVEGAAERMRRSEIEELRAAAHRRQAERGTRPATAAAEENREAAARKAAAQLKKEMLRRGHDKRPPTERGPRIDAERKFEEGRRLLANNKLPQAHAAFEKASELMPEAAEYRLHALWCRYIEEKDPLHREVYEQELRTCALEALNENRKLGFAHYVHGRLFLNHENLEAAEKALRFASKIDPGHVESKRFLRLVQRRRNSPSRG